MKFFFTLTLFFSFAATAQTREELYDQFNSLANAGKPDEALPIAQKFVEATKKETGENHIEYSNAITYLGVIYFNLGKLRNADSLFLAAAAIRKKLGGPNDAAYLSSLKDIAVIQDALGNPDSALVCLEQAAKAWKETSGEISFEHAYTLDNIAGVYKGMNDFEKAASNYVAAGDTWKKVAGEFSAEYVGNRFNLANLYDAFARYDKAEQITREYLSIQEKRVGKEHSDYASGVSLLGLIYLKLGRFEKAEPLLREAVLIEKNSGNETAYATSLGNLANMYLDMGHYKKALPFMLESTEILKKLNGQFSAAYATGISNLSVLYNEMEEYDKSIAKAEEAVAIRKEILAPSDPAYAVSLNNLAGAYFQQEKYPAAEKLFAEVIELRRKTLGENHPEYANALSNMASMYYETRKYVETENLLLKAMGIRKNILGEKHPDYAINLNNLAILYTTLGQFEKAEHFIMKSNSIRQNNIVNTFTLLSESEKAEYLENRVWVVDESNSLLYNAGKSSPEFLRHSFDQLVFFKSMLLSDSRNMLKMVQGSTDEKLRTVFDQWKNLRKTLAEEYAQPLENRIPDLQEKEMNAEILEKTLMQQSAEFRHQQQSLNVGFNEIRNALAADEAAIEFVRFDYFNEEWKDTTLYAAYIVRPDGNAPVFVPLFEESQLQKIFDAAGNHAPRMASLFYQSLEGNKINPGKFGSQLYSMIWAPLENHLKGIKKISYSPSGLLYKIALHAIPTDSIHLLGEKYQLNQFASTRDRLFKESRLTTGRQKGIVLIGDPDFTMDSLQLVKQRGQQQESNSSPALAGILERGERGSAWDSLPGSANEVKKISELFGEQNIPAQAHTKTAASESVLKSLGGNAPGILHIATHGFFLPGPGEQKKSKGMGMAGIYRQAEDPLLRSGLILSGGNYAWSGKAPISGIEDGIVTAFEIAQLDLAGTELVVLSACKTALGDIKGSEGVFGLQRAFKMAGVKNMIVSLWSVPDKETTELMTSFYTYLISGKTIPDAFSLAQSGMREKYPAYFWAAFVLVQ